MEGTATRVAHRIDADRRDEFVAKGFRSRHFFPHTLRFLPKAGPDGYKLADRMVGRGDVDELWEIVLFADDSMLAEFPAELFFDDEVVWHQQQFGLPGQIATANIVLRGDTLWSMVHISDLVQRIGRRRELKTLVENRFRGWQDMLLNGLLAFAVQHGVHHVRLPRSALAMRNTDTKRTVQRELFERIYDRGPARLYRVEAAGDWWVLEVARNADRLVEPRVRRAPLEVGRRVCVCHDVERELGHDPSDRLPDQDWDAVLKDMLAVERSAGVKATYNVVGKLLEEVGPEISADGHCLAFHSFDHRIDRLEQLTDCRRLDYRLKGYRPPRSVITDELTDEHLLFHNFEWIASSERSLGIASPVLQRRIVRIPVTFDDFDLYAGGTPFDEWEAEALRRIDSRDVAVFALHDCYAFLWLDRYKAFLERVLALGETRTLNELAAELTLDSGT